MTTTPKISNAQAVKALDFDTLTEDQLKALEDGAKGQRTQRSAARNITLAETVASMMPQTSAPPLAER